ncbi:MAG: hypothetical protein HQ538_03340 [Parcubacteria group bacterium]|nr:hypothetical protein [Parcubacteria group bacterium]
MIEDLKTKVKKVFGGGVVKPSIKDSKIKAEEIFGDEDNKKNIETSKEEPKFNREKKETEDRSIIAKALIYCFLGGIGLILVGVPIHNALVIENHIDLINILTTYSGILGPFVGVIAGYYFKN